MVYSQFVKQLEKLEPDPFMGKRVHAWVAIMLPTEQTTKPDPEDETDHETSQAVFIETSTGFVIAKDDPNYFSIEAVWNQHNYYVSPVHNCNSIN